MKDNLVAYLTFELNNPWGIDMLKIAKNVNEYYYLIHTNLTKLNDLIVSMSYINLMYFLNLIYYYIKQIIFY